METLDDPELAMLTLTAERAGLADGQDVVDLGCGWGSFSLWAAARYPRSRFTGAQLLHHFQTDLQLEAEWHLSGTHYARTAEAWYARLMAKRAEVEAILAGAYGTDAARRFQRWRVFFLACAELFGYRHGREWIVAHYRFAPR